MDTLYHGRLSQTQIYVKSLQYDQITSRSQLTHDSLHFNDNFVVLLTINMHYAYLIRVQAEERVELKHKKKVSMAKD